MSSVVAIIKSVIGQVFAVSIEGVQRQIFEGDRLLQGEQLLTGNLGAVTLQTTDGKAIELGNNQQWPLREEESKQQDVDEDASVEELQQAIAAGVDPSAEMDDTAAGPAAAGGSGGGGFGGGHSFVMLDATGQQLQAEVGYTTGGLGEPGAAQGIEQERNDNPLSPLELDPVAPSLVISGETQSLLIGQSTQIRFSFSESVQGFGAADIAASGGTISNLVQIDATTWVATFTRGPSDAPGISVPAGSYTDLVGNPGIAGSLAINGAPQTSDSNTTTGENSVLESTVPAASDVDGMISSYTLLTGPAAGSLTFNPNGSHSFNPGNAFDDLAVGESRDVTFTYTATDNNGAVSAPASVTITITGTNDAAVISGDISQSAAETNTALTLTGTLTSSDVDNAANTFTATEIVRPNGTFTLQANGQWTFVASSPFNELNVGQQVQEVFAVTSLDGTPQNVTVTITGTNDSPAIADASVSLNENVAAGTAVINVSDSFTGTNLDRDGDAITYSITGGNAAGIFVINSATGAISIATGKTLDYETASQHVLTVTASDGSLSDTAAITVNVNNLNEPPVNALPANYTTSEDTAFKLSGLSVSDIDAGSANLTVTLSVASGTLTASNAADVIISGSGTGELILTGSQTAINNYLANTGTQPTYTPVPNANGTVALTMTTSDNGGSGSGGTKTDADTVNIVITPVNDATAPTVTSTLKGQWTFNESSGSSTTSNQSTGASGTLNDTTAPTNTLPSFSSAGARNVAAGNYIEFRDAGDRVDVDASATQALMGTSSMAFWINTLQKDAPNSGSSSSWDLPTVLGSEQNSGGNDIQWGAINNSGKIGFGLGNVGGVYSTTSINNDQWHHVVITRDATSKLVQVYVNGVLEASGSPNETEFNATLNRLTSIGVNNNFARNGSDLNDNRFFQGKLDDLRIYNRVLTADQIQAVRAVENGFQNTALANDGNAILLALSGTYSAMTVSGLLAGMTISSGANSVTVSGPDQAVDLTGWDLSNLQLSNAGTGSTTLLFTAQATDATTGDIATTYHAVSLANGTSQLLDLAAGADTRTASSAADLIRGGAGDDVLNGAAGNDRLEGGADNDTLNGDAGNDLLIGDAGNDILFGGADNDTLLGGNDTDSLRGGSGNDLLVGGNGADTFLWKNGDTGNDVIKDFKSAEGDRIDLSDLLPDAANTGDITQYLQIDTLTSTLKVSTAGTLNSGGSADVTIKLENGSGGNADLSSLGTTSTQIVNSLIAGADPIVKIDHS